MLHCVAFDHFNSTVFGFHLVQWDHPGHDGGRLEPTPIGLAIVHASFRAQAVKTTLFPIIQHRAFADQYRIYEHTSQSTLSFTELNLGGFCTKSRFRKRNGIQRNFVFGAPPLFTEWLVSAGATRISGNMNEPREHRNNICRRHSPSLQHRFNICHRYTCMYVYMYIHLDTAMCTPPQQRNVMFENKVS
jgi:hypothetical protein